MKGNILVTLHYYNINWELITALDVNLIITV